jgi:hypothetical protein
MKPKFFLASILSVTLFFSCQKDSINEDLSNQNNFIVKEGISSNNNLRSSLDEPCLTVDLIAGQNDIVGTVTIDRNDTHLILTYSTIGDWEIDLTHMSIGDCNEEWVPETGSGNPKIGHFEHTQPHSETINEVVYFINLNILPDYTDLYCFAAHAEVSSSNGGETAWAGQIGGQNSEDNSEEEYNVIDFDGNSWAMYIQASQTSCDVVDNETPDDGGTR